MKATKILNNNAVIIEDNGQEKIAIGSGVGFNKTKNDSINPSKIEKKFVLEENEKLEQLLLRIPEEHFILSEEIIAYAEEKLGVKMNIHILFALSDHLSFAIECDLNYILIQNIHIIVITVIYLE